MRQERSRRLARAVLWRPGKNRTSKSRLQSSSNSRRTGRAPSALSFLHRSDLPHAACVKSVLEDSPARSCGVRERTGRANPAFSLRAIRNAMAERLPFFRVANRSDLPHEACVKSVLEDSPARSGGVWERTGRANPASPIRLNTAALRTTQGCVAFAVARIGATLNA